MADHEELAGALRRHADLAETSRDVVEVPVGLLVRAADALTQSEARVRRVAEAVMEEAAVRVQHFADGKTIKDIYLLTALHNAANAARRTDIDAILADSEGGGR